MWFCLVYISVVTFDIQMIMGVVGEGTAEDLALMIALKVIGDVAMMTSHRPMIGNLIVGGE